MLNQLKPQCKKILRGTFFCNYRFRFPFLNRHPPHNSQRIDANTDATNNTTKTTLTTQCITYQHIPTHTNTYQRAQTQTHHPSPAQIQAHFIPGGTRLAQLCQDSCFLHDLNIIAKQGMDRSPRTLTLRQVRAVCTERADWTSAHCHSY